ncbi:UDP-N-acetylglucosamine 2-epimerase [Fervidobacterium gondwanense DSM 13020]|uniref:UDP-N-acetylglucosamine 2-epimerase n=1 Tax=Fervidobacterium gondwanense DSM 13020 TaxID=1121883 RepID=A0A1M7RSX9_FERGO|nr:UDP-N-acetylglucosamine 2-epimerase [Fervidobacterium gondwanense DSM 13020]
MQNYLKDITVIEPVDYLNLMGLVKRSWKVITGSGGLQKEAYFAKKQAVVLMNDTGCKELVDIRLNRLADKDELYKIVMCECKVKYHEEVSGTGDPAAIVGEILRSKF